MSTMTLHDKVFKALSPELYRDDELHEEAEKVIAIVIEECARVVEGKKEKPNEIVGAIWNEAFDAAAAAIRALKDEP